MKRLSKYVISIVITTAVTRLVNKYIIDKL